MKRQGPPRAALFFLPGSVVTSRGAAVEASNFADRLLEAIETKRSHVVVGFDPDYDLLPLEVREAYPRDAYGSEAEMKARLLPQSS